MRYLITGGAGFIGTHLFKKLIYRGDEVICLDNLYTGKKSNIQELLDSNKEFIQEYPKNPIGYLQYLDTIDTVVSNLYNKIGLKYLKSKPNKNIYQQAHILKELNVEIELLKK